MTLAALAVALVVAPRLASADASPWPPSTATRAAAIRADSSASPTARSACASAGAIGTPLSSSAASAAAKRATAAERRSGPTTGSPRSSACHCRRPSGAVLQARHPAATSAAATAAGSHPARTASATPSTSRALAGSC